MTALIQSNQFHDSLPCESFLLINQGESPRNYMYLRTHPHRIIMNQAHIASMPLHSPPPTKPYMVLYSSPLIALLLDTHVQCRYVICLNKPGVDWTEPYTATLYHLCFQTHINSYTFLEHIHVPPYTLIAPAHVHCIILHSLKYIHVLVCICVPYTPCTCACIQ